MGINKVQYGNTTLIDLTSDTVTADKLMQGYTAHDRTGALITGTATGGGGSVIQDQDGFIVLPPDGGGSPSVGGLVYETGTWTPSEDIVEPTINFTNTHSARPISIVMCDVNGTTMAQYTNAVFMYTGLYDAFGTVVTSGTDYYGRVNFMRYSSGTTLSTGGFNLTSMTGTVTSAVSYFVSSASFKPYIGGSYYWRAGRTYKWIAVWAPTT